MPRPTVLLFDIDGTLLTSGGVGRRALQRAFAELFDRPDATSSFRLDGMTDRRIARQALTAIGQPVTDAAIDAVLTRYLAILEEEIAAADMSRYRVFAGCREAVNAALDEEHIAVGLGTGNVRAGARLKLNKVGLFSPFSFGGFGCDHEERVELIRRGAERGAQKLGAPISECRVVVIGDTPKDVLAAQGIGAECVGVGTGHYKAAELREAGARYAFDDLATEEARAVLLSDV